MKTILSVGEVLWDLLPTGPQLGGAPLNFVFRANSLGDRGLMVSRLGRDELGDRAAATIEALGLDCSLLQRDPSRPTGVVHVSFCQGQPDYVIVPGVAYDHIEATADVLDAAAEADCVCFGTLIQRCDDSRQALQEVLAAASRATKLLDINLRKDCHTPQTIRQSLAAADVLRLNDHEAAYLAQLLGLPAVPLEDFATAVCHQWQLECCVVTLGAQGAMAVRPGEKPARCGGHSVAVADTVGAGDAFTAGFIHRYLRGAPLEECCRWGNALGALVATQHGGTSPIADGRLRQLLDG